jgi:hypothetical protein
VLDDETDDDGSVFLVMELLEGETLAHRFERKLGRSSSKKCFWCPTRCSTCLRGSR